LTDFLFYGDTPRFPALRHELPIPMVDAVLLGMVGGRLHVMSTPLERRRIEEAVPGAVLHDIADLGFRDLRESGLSPFEIDLELASRAAAGMGVREAVADPAMPVAIADRLRADGIVLHIDHAAVAVRRRVKTRPEAEGIRRAAAAAEAGIAAAATLLREAVPEGDRLVVGGDPLTAEAVRAVLREACREHGAPAPPNVIVASIWQGSGHDPGSGPLPANLPIVVDLWPQDERSGCFADMTRTFVVGEVSEELQAQAALVRRALERVREAVRPGITGRELHGLACEVFEAAGWPTQRTDPDADEGFQFSLGHGVGLEVHEEPALGPAGRDPLMAGDVVAVEPGLWRDGIGEVLFEDLLLVTENGGETLTGSAYDLRP
jgi:Xaa-Pro aminopeptidase